MFARNCHHYCHYQTGDNIHYNIGHYKNDSINDNYCDRFRAYFEWS